MDTVEIVVVANGCTDGTKEYLESLPETAHLKIVWNDEPLGYTRATNLGIKASSGDYIIFLNNDVVILDFCEKSKWIEMLIDPLIVGIAGVTGPVLAYDYHSERNFIIFFCAATSRELVEKVGYLNEEWSPGGGEDVEYCIEVENLGYKLLRVPEEAPISVAENGMWITQYPAFHSPESTMLDEEHAEEWHKVIERNNKLLEHKFKLPYGWFTPDDIKEYRRLINLVPDNGTIGELGAGLGRSICSVSDIIKRKNLKVIDVDTFEGTESEKTEEQKLIKTDYEQEFKDNAKRFGIDVTTCRGKTNEVYNQFEDNTFDLLFIDADHVYEAIKGDIENWESKVKENGIICGHDYTNREEVKRAVDEKYKGIKLGGSIWSHQKTKQDLIFAPKNNYIKENRRKEKVLAYICTCNRYDTTLPMSIMSIINQTYKPDKFMIFDDNKEPRDPRNIEHYNYLFRLLAHKGIDFEYIWALKKGAHFSHEMANMSGFDLAWFIDDDCVADPDCLKELMNEMGSNVGAVGGLIMQPQAGELPPHADNKIDNLSLPNIQWFNWTGEPRKVEHIYSSFLYRCGIVHHDLRLSSVVFRGETMFTHSLLLKGFDLIVTPKAITWHFEGSGGCRSDVDQKVREEKYSHDEQLFRNWLSFQKTGKKLIVLNCGIGDSWAARTALPKIREHFSGKKIIIACCYPQVFEGEDIETISIAAAQSVCDIKDYDIYAWMNKNNWKGKLFEAFEKMYESL